MILWILASGVDAATYTVTRFNDPSVSTVCSEFDCSLRQAVMAANNNPGADEIILLPSEHQLTRDGDDDAAVVGDLDITDDLTIIGTFVSNVPLEISSLVGHSGFSDRIFDVHPGVNLTLKHVLIQQGNNLGANGGGIRSIEAGLDLENVHLIDNSARNGSGIYAINSQLNLNHVKFRENHSPTVAGFGGGLYASGGQLRIQDSEFTDNIADFGGALAVVNFIDQNQLPAIVIKDSYLGDNLAQFGGGIFLRGGSANNQGSQTAHVQNTRIRFNLAAQGAGIHHQSGKLYLSAVSITQNRATDSQVTFDATGGAIYAVGGAAKLHVEHSLIFNNESTDHAAAVYFSGDQIKLFNSTIGENQAPEYAALYLNAGQVELMHNTVLFNQSQNGEDIFFGSKVTAVLQNNILMARCTTTFLSQVSSLGGNIESPGDSCGLDPETNDLFGWLQRGLVATELADNGGPTMTYAITNPLSNAINRGVMIPELMLDQRYYIRGDQPDSGAYEWQSNGMDLIYFNGFQAGL
ncbi:choice-of-anchor Q domain-containing protein [Marinicella meishanensis]|uniref:choice-of-anchor Q domain-containing protein n=1 Tax=Marinicella meishanensis TaxID=2873263 RepID=UPI001CBBA693|nr:choice-of-anchor Q domain-containing protein [Marinicella sp. NBU2979]